MKVRIFLLGLLLLCICGIVSCGGELHGHDWSLWETEIAPTCTEPGKEIRRCDCGLTERQAIPAKGHTKGGWITTKQPTCTETGSKYLSCTDCTAALETQTIPENGHKNIIWVTTKQPTCTETGSGYLSCTDCTEIFETKTIPYDRTAFTL